MSKLVSNLFPADVVLAVTANIPVQNPAPAYALVRHVLNAPKMDLHTVLRKFDVARAEIVKQHPELAAVQFPVDKYYGLPPGKHRDTLIARTNLGVPLHEMLEVVPVKPPLTLVAGVNSNVLVA